MKQTTTLKLEIDHSTIRNFCRTNHIQELSLFGSVLREDFSLDSDVDILVSFLPGKAVSLFDIVQMEEDLSAIIGRNVDLVTRYSVETSDNYLRRNHVLSSLEPLYVA